MIWIYLFNPYYIDSFEALEENYIYLYKSAEYSAKTQ